MKRIILLALGCTLLTFMACYETEVAQEVSQETTIQLPEANMAKGSMNAQIKRRVVTANRASGDISVIDTDTKTVIGTYPMPNNGEPMYVVHVPQADAVFVGDRANNQVVVFDEDDYAVIGTVPAGNGVFHMWVGYNARQLWVNNDIDNTTTVIDPVNLSVITTVPTPADLVALGGKPHDVFISPNADDAYVTVLGVSGANDYVVKFDTRTFQETGRAAVGKDPHIAATRSNDVIYVPCQGADGVFVIDRNNMNILKMIAFNAAHGAGITGNGQYFYTADIVGSKLGTIDVQTNTLVGPPVDTPFPVAHNVIPSDDNTQLFVTHSGATNDKLSIYDINPTPTLCSSLTVGLNPFGLAYYRYR